MTGLDNTTICAVSTAPGAGGVAVIRVSGPEALTISDKVYRAKGKGKSILTQEPYTLSFGNILRGEEVIDEVLVGVFHAPHSFTGENTVEITCHGSVFIQEEIVRLLLSAGCRMAAPGEFTQRAFLHGKMDLSQAEAVADLIASSSAAAHRLAMNQMRGGISHELEKLSTQLLHFVTLIELELDFSEEDVEFADRSQLLSLAADIERVIARLADSFRLGNAVKNGVPTVIVGETNVGKSTLLNFLLNEERAIVSDVHGTTRDVIEDIITIKGIDFRFIDTAGIRDTGDEIESLGIERTFKKIEQAAIVVWMIDATQFSERIEEIADQIIPRVTDKPLIIVFNKVDRIDAEEQIILQQEFLPDLDVPRIYLSAKYKINTEQLEETLLRAARLSDLDKDDVIVTNLRHYEALQQALEAIQRVNTGLRDGLSGDLLSQDIRECLFFLGQITGKEIRAEEVLGNIFRNFCIGK